MHEDDGMLPDDLFDVAGAEDGDRQPDSEPPRRSINARVAAALRNVVPSALAERWALLWSAAQPYLRKRRVQASMATACAVLLGLGTLLIVVGFTAHKNPPTAPAPNAAQAVIETPTAQPTEAPTAPSSAPASPTPEPTITATGSIPIRITVPAIGVDANIMQLGLNADKTVQVPPLSEVRTAGWYKYSSTPGATGPSIILGHIDSAAYGLGVFFKLGDVRQGNIVTVLRADHMLATFSVTSVAEYPKTAFPTMKVYGTTTGATLRLVTCGGRFDSATKSYLDNIVVYANLVTLASA
jgi:hypothetical protein